MIPRGRTPKTRVGFTGAIRIGTRVLAMVATLFLLLPLYFILRIFTNHNPIPRVFLQMVCAFAGVRVEVTGMRPKPGTLLLANHVSWIDIPAIGGATGSAFVAHDGLASIGILRWLCSLNDTVFIARDRRHSVHRQIEQIREALDDTGSLTIFPEGTTGDGSRLLPFKSALLSALAPIPDGLSIQPVWMDYGQDSPAIAWVGSESGLANFFRILARRKALDVTIHFISPLDREETKDRKAMALCAMQAIEIAMQDSQGRSNQRVAL